MSCFLKTKEFAILSIKWGNPYTEPPDRMSRILWAVCVPWPWPFEKENFFKLYPNEWPDGYFMSWQPGDIKKPKRWSPDAVAKNRRKRMEERIRRKDPLFADQFIKAQLSKKPEYYDPDAIKKEKKQHHKYMAEIDESILNEWENIRV